MDVFSAGCVIAELFTESPIFNLSQLFKYRKGEYDPSYGYLGKIQDTNIREMVAHMIQIQPESRYSAEEYLHFWRSRAFPEYFYGFLHQYLGSITDPSSGRSEVHPDDINFGEADDRIDKIHYDFEKIAYFLEYDSLSQQMRTNPALRGTSGQVLPVHIDIPNHQHEALAACNATKDDGSLIFLTLVASSLGHTARASSKIRACDLMLAFAERVTDEAKFDRILPYLVFLLVDRFDTVKIASLRSLTQVLTMIRTVTPVNAYTFTEFIRPRLLHFTEGPGTKASGPLCRTMYAWCLSALAHASLRIIDVVDTLNVDGSLPLLGSDTQNGTGTPFQQTSFDNAKAELLSLFEMQTKALLTDSDISVRRALLSSVASLCIFFGSTRAGDVVLSHLNTYLNHHDWMLKCAFFRTIVGVATFVGGPALEEFVLPLMIQSLHDSEEFVVREVLSSFASMAELGLIQRSKIFELVDICARYMIHPNVWIRESSVHFIAASSWHLTIADRQCLVAPLVRPYLKVTITDFLESSLLDSVKKPITRSAIKTATLWAHHGKKAAFWDIDTLEQTISFTLSGLAQPGYTSKEIEARSLAKIQRTEEDLQWIRKLREAGLDPDEDFKLFALREQIRRNKDAAHVDNRQPQNADLENLVFLKDLQITPQNVFFELEQVRLSQKETLETSEKPMSKAKEKINPVHTITDALLDASSTGASPSMARKIHNENSKRRETNGAFDGNSIPRHGHETPRPVVHEDETKPADAGVPTHQLIPTEETSAADEVPSSQQGVSGVKSKGNSDLHHKSSAIHLLNNRDATKTAAETATIAANVSGTMEGPQHGTQLSSMKMGDSMTSKGLRPGASRSNVVHSYSGQDPTVLGLLDSLASDLYPTDMLDFGPQVVPVNKRHALQVADDHKAKVEFWQPKGTLVAAFGEHTTAINRVLASPDHAFFVTASDDGTVKVWDTNRLERNLSHRSRLTFVHSSNARVVSLTFIENTHTFVSAATDGSIKVVKVEYNVTADTTRYGRLRVVREYQLQTAEYAQWLEHTKTEKSSLLLIATNQSRIVGLDLKNMTEVYVLQNPVHHGTLNCMCVNHKQGWLVVGTSHGVLDLWDLRFLLRLRAWSMAGGKPIYRVIASPFHQKEKKIFVIGGTGQNDITIWDLEKRQCSEVFHVGAVKATGKDVVKPYEAWQVDEDRPEGMLGRFATAIDPHSEGAGSQEAGIRALQVELDDYDEQLRGTSSGFFLTGGADRKVRHWRYPLPAASNIVSGLGSEEPQPKYVTSYPTTGLNMHVERSSTQSSGGNETIGKSKKSSKQPRNTVISLQQQSLLKNHLDEVMDVCVLKQPVQMTVSVDRMGCIRIFQ